MFYLWSKVSSIFVSSYSATRILSAQTKDAVGRLSFDLLSLRDSDDEHVTWSSAQGVEKHCEITAEIPTFGCNQKKCADLIEGILFAQKAKLRWMVKIAIYCLDGENLVTDHLVVASFVCENSRNRWSPWRNIPLHRYCRLHEMGYSYFKWNPRHIIHLCFLFGLQEKIKQCPQIMFRNSALFRLPASSLFSIRNRSLCVDFLNWILQFYKLNNMFELDKFRCVQFTVFSSNYLIYCWLEDTEK